MFQTMHWNVILLLLATISQGFGREQVCSKFHYEEQLLEKMIRQEIQVKEMETEIKKTLESIATFMDNIAQKMNNKADNLNNEINQNLNKVSTLMANMEQKMNNKADDLNNEINQTVNKVSTFMDEIQQKMDGYKDDMTDRKNELQLLTDKVDVPRVAFHVYNVNDINLRMPGQIFIFTTILLNEGNGYKSSTGKFTASVAGLYYFTAHVCNFYGKYVYYGIIVDDKTVAASVQRDNDNDTCSSVSAITALKTGSSVSVQKLRVAHLTSYIKTLTDVCHLVVHYFTSELREELSTLPVQLSYFMIDALSATQTKDNQK